MSSKESFRLCLLAGAASLCISAVKRTSTPVLAHFCGDAKMAVKRAEQTIP
jgi:hypothetical protein